MNPRKARRAKLLRTDRISSEIQNLDLTINVSTFEPRQAKLEESSPVNYTPPESCSSGEGNKPRNRADSLSPDNVPTYSRSPTGKLILSSNIKNNINKKTSKLEKNVTFSDLTLIRNSSENNEQALDKPELKVNVNATPLVINTQVTPSSPNTPFSLENNSSPKTDCSSPQTQGSSPISPRSSKSPISILMDPKEGDLIRTNTSELSEKDLVKTDEEKSTLKNYKSEPSKKYDRRISQSKKFSFDSAELKFPQIVKTPSQQLSKIEKLTGETLPQIKLTPSVSQKANGLAVPKHIPKKFSFELTPEQRGFLDGLINKNSTPRIGVVNTAKYKPSFFAQLAKRDSILEKSKDYGVNRKLKNIVADYRQWQSSLNKKA